MKDGHFLHVSATATPKNILFHIPYPQTENPKVKHPECTIPGVLPGEKNKENNQTNHCVAIIR